MDLLHLFDAFDVESDLDLIADYEPPTIQRFVPHHAEIFSIQLSVPLKSGSRVAPRVFRHAVKISGQNDFFRDAAYR